MDDMTKLVYKNLKNEIEMLKGGKKGDKLGQTFKKLMSEYNQFKRNQVQHFRFDSVAYSTKFVGKVVSNENLIRIK